MIINELAKYYEILARDERSGVPPYGYSNAKVGFALNISAEGDLLDVIPLHVEEQVGKKTKLFLRVLTVPEQKLRSSGIAPNFMCDNSTYVLGIDNKGKPKRSKNAFEAFKKLHHEILGAARGQAAKAVLAFLDKWKVDKSKQHPALKDYLEEILKGSNLVFRLDGTTGYLHNDEEIKKLWEDYNSKDEDDIFGQCLVTGTNTAIAKLHPVIKNVKKAQSSGASIVSFNAPSYESYGKKQSYNSPVGKKTAFAYTTVLNHMLSSQKQKIQVGDATTVFWAASPEEIYTDLAAELFNPTITQEGKKGSNEYKRDAHIEQLVNDVLTKAKSGQRINDLDGKIDPKTKFHILGLSPNASRISIRFFHSDSFGGFTEKIAQHYKDMEIVKDFDNRPSNIPIWMMLNETISPKSTNRDAPPLLAGAVMRSIISGAPYPASLFNAVMIRVRTDMDDKDKNIQRVNYVRVAIIKAYLLRNARLYKNKKLEEVLTVSLNEHSDNTGYLLGRLFAVLEKAQQDANPGINATIKDRYFASACATPGAVFPILLKLAQHHISKSDYGYAIERRIESIMVKITNFPSHLTLEQQGTFILGYYHQRVALFQKSDN
ncbi:type I-C CRISPR-associated protein Cas8c/Csd1 [Desulfofalx alkaliphila]|uniref:type I-C CRISPR-associated protein Cas8c/Csd1 n=1 Tax=Desulfofalx alkaliphila TaxID=105483 RepID=UPI0004E199DB|nr:type I-C CRISPR-associated protein Cas8c/Csd1 [Desulfofalx alkaliphila]